MNTGPKKWWGSIQIVFNFLKPLQLVDEERIRVLEAYKKTKNDLEEFVEYEVIDILDGLLENELSTLANN